VDGTVSVLACLQKGSELTLRSPTCKQLNHPCPAHREERHTRLASHSFGQQRLACSGWADEQDPPRNLCPQPSKPSRAAQELHDLFQFSTNFIDPRDIGKGHRGLGTFTRFSRWGS